LEEYVYMINSMSKRSGEQEGSSALTLLIGKALSQSNLFFFGELFELEPVKRLKNSPTSSKWYHLLELFAYGTYRDYLAQKEHLPELSPPQIKKLRQLTLVSLASKTKILPYNFLLEELGLNNVRELEDLIIDSIYLGLIHAKLDQKHSRLELDYAVGRDVTVQQIDQMISHFHGWCTRSEQLLQSLDQKMEYIQQKNQEMKDHQKTFEQQQEMVRMKIKASEEAMTSGQSLGTMSGVNSGSLGGGSLTSPHLPPDLDDPRARKRPGKGRKPYNGPGYNPYM